MVLYYKHPQTSKGGNMYPSSSKTATEAPSKFHKKKQKKTWAPKKRVAYEQPVFFLGVKGGLQMDTSSDTRKGGYPDAPPAV